MYIKKNMLKRMRTYSIYYQLKRIQAPRVNYNSFKPANSINFSYIPIYLYNMKLKGNKNQSNFKKLQMHTFQF